MASRISLSFLRGKFLNLPFESLWSAGDPNLRTAVAQLILRPRSLQRQSWGNTHLIISIDSRTYLPLSHFWHEWPYSFFKQHSGALLIQDGDVDTFLASTSGYRPYLDPESRSCLVCFCHILLLIHTTAALPVSVQALQNTIISHYK